MTFRRNKFPRFLDFFKHRAKTLLLPYAMFSVLTWAIWAAYKYLMHDEVKSYWMPLLQTVLAQGSGSFLVHNYPLWFIPCLFAIEMIYYWLDKLPDWGKITASITLATVGTLMMHVWKGWFLLLPWSLECALTSTIFYCCGNLLVKHYRLKGIEAKVLQRKALSFFVLLVLTVLLVFSAHYNGRVTVVSALLSKSLLLFYLNAFMGIVTIGQFSILVCSIRIENKYLKRIFEYHL